MKKLILICAFLSGFLFNLKSQSPGVTFRTEILGTSVNVIPEISIPNVTSYNCYWTFGNGATSTDEFPGWYDYYAYGSFYINLTVTYREPGLNTLGTISLAFSKWVTLAPDTYIPENTSLQPSVNMPLGTVFNVGTYNIGCSINPVYALQGFSWKLLVNGIERGYGTTVNQSTFTFNNISFPSEGIYTLELLVTNSQNLGMYAYSKPISIRVSQNQNSCNACMKSEIWQSGNLQTMNNRTVVEQGTNPKFNYFVAIYQGMGSIWPCTYIDPYGDPLPLKQVWTANGIPIQTNNFPQGQTYDFDLNLSGLHPGEYTISCLTSPVDETKNWCELKVETFAKIKIKPNLILSKNEVSFPINGGTKNIAITGPNTTNPSGGKILVDGDWITIEKFSNTELKFSCSASNTEDRHGRIIVSFPECYASKTIYINQSRSTWEVATAQSLSLAIDNSEAGATIIMKEGTYKLPVHIRGKNITLASKYLTTGDPYYIDKTIIDAGGNGSAIRIEGYSKDMPKTSLIGFHIKGGNAENGGGIYCSNTNVELQNVLVHNNYAKQGGGIFTNNSIIYANHLTLTGNDADGVMSNYYRKYGHMLYLYNASEVVFANSILGGSENDYHIGGVYFNLNSPRSSFTLNYSVLPGSRSYGIDPGGLVSTNIVYFHTSAVMSLYYNNASFSQDEYIGYENPANQNYWLKSNSYYRRKGNDGRALGALYHPYNEIDKKVITVNPKALNFKDIILGDGSQTQAVEIKNVSQYYVTAIAEFEQNTDDYRIVPEVINLKKGESKMIYVIFDPKSYGVKNNKIKIRTRSSNDIQEVSVNAYCGAKPDLVCEITQNQIDIKSGCFLNSLFFAVRNDGGTVAMASSVKFYLSYMPVYSENAVYIGLMNTGELLPGEKQYLQPNNISVPQGTSTGNYFLLAIADAENLIDEQNESNNLLAKQIQVEYCEPGLIVENIKLLDPEYEFQELGRPGVLAGNQLKVSFKVKNLWDIPIDFTTKIYISDNNSYEPTDIALKTIGNMSLGANSATNTIQTITIPAELAPGNYYLLFRAFEKWLPEDNLRIKVASTNFEVLKLPDYHISGTPEFHISFYPGEDVSFHFSISNTSNSSAPATTVKYYFSPDSEWDPNDVLLSASAVPDLPWNDPYLQLNHQISIPEGVTPGTWYIILKADPDNMVEESDETNNENFLPIHIKAYPDLIASNLQLNTSNIMAGTPVYASVNIKNLGYGEAPPSKLKFYLSGDNKLQYSLDYELGEVLIDALSPNAEVDISSFELPIPLEAGGGTWYIFAKADGELSCLHSWCEIKESDESNNSISTQLNVWRQPDLYLTNMRLTQNNATISSVVMGSVFNLEYQVNHSNGNMFGYGNPSGLSFAGQNKLTCYLSADEVLDISDDLVLSTNDISATYGNSMITGVLSLIIPSNINSGDWNLFVVIDSDNVISERDEMNNIWSQAIEIRSLPDLIVTNLFSNPNVMVQGLNNIAHISGIIQNTVPGANAGIVYLEWYFSYDGFLNANDIFMDKIFVGTLENSGSLVFDVYPDIRNGNWPTNLQAGSYNLIFKTTCSNQESSTGNNTASIPFVISQPADIQIASLILDKTTIQEGTNFTVSCVVQNNNATTTEPFVLNFNLDVSSNSNSPSRYNLEYIPISGLAQGESITINRTYVVPIGSPAIYFNAICDVNNSNFENDKSNNLYSIPIELYQIVMPLTVNAIVTNATTPGGNNGSAVSSGLGGVPGYSYAWYKDGALLSNSQEIYNLSAGQYEVKVTDGIGTSVSKMIDISQPNPLVATINVLSHLSAYNSNDGIVEINIESGNPPYTVCCLSNGINENWPVGKTSALKTGLPPGFRIYNITDSKGYMAYLDTRIFNKMNITSSLNNVTTFGGNNGEITIIQVDGGVSPYTYSWKKNGINYSTQEDLTGLTSGEYTLIVTDYVGATANAEFTIIQPDPLVVEYTINNISEKGLNDGAISLNIISGTPPYQFTWSRADGQTYSSTSKDISGLKPGTYMVSINSGDLSQYQSFIITVQSLEFIVKSTDIKLNGGNDGSITLTPKYGNPGYSYEWKKDGVYYSNSQSLTNLSVGEYTVTASDIYGLTGSETIQISQPEEWIIEYSKKDVSFYNGADGAIDISVSGGNPPYTYSWSNGKTTEDIGNLSAGTYIFAITDKNSLTLNKVIEIKNPINIVGGKTNNNLVGGSSGEIHFRCYEGYYPYNLIVYKDGNEFWNKSSINSGDLNALNNLYSGEYTAVFSDANNNTASKTYFISDPVSVQLIVKQLSSIESNDGEASVILSGGLPPYSYQWTKDNVSFSNERDIENLAPGNYHVRVTDSEGRTGTSAATITPYMPTAIISGGGVICNNGSQAIIDLEFTGRPPFQIYLNNGSNLIHLYGITTNHYQYITDVPGTYTINSGRDQLYSFTSKTGSASVFKNALPTAVLSGGGSLCQNDGIAKLLLDLTGEAPWEITYTNGILIFNESNILSSHFEIETTIPGEYTILSVNDANCTGTSFGTASVISGTTPTAMLSGGNGLCEIGGNAVIDISLSGTAPWNITYTDGNNFYNINGIQTSNYQFSASTPGNYSITSLTDANECDGFGVNILEVLANKNPEINLGEDREICEGTTTIIDAGSFYPVYKWNGQNGNSTLEVNTGGIYSLEVTDENGCTATDELLVTINPNPIIDLGPDIITTNDSYLYLEAQAGFQSYQWSGNNNCRILCISMQNVINSTNISLTVVDDHGCSGSDNVNLFVEYQAPAQNIIHTNGNMGSISKLGNESINNDDVQYKLFPNPTDGKLYISISDISKVKQIILYDSKGVMMKKFQNITNSPFGLDFSNYAKGLYIIKIIEDITIKEFKIIRN